MSAVRDLLSDLVAIDSVNPDLQAGAAGEGVIAGYVVEWLERTGVEVTWQEPAPGRPNVIGRIPGSRGGRSLMLNAHTDTVDLRGMTAPLTARIEGDRLYGRGAYDMKGSLAAILLVAADVAKDPLAGDLIVTAVCDEEYGSIGTQAIVEAYRADAAIVTEPTDLKVCVAHKGFIWFDIETRGVAAHGSLPEVGIDAIAKMGPILSGIAALDVRLGGREPHPLLGTGSIHASTINGGVGLSTYPDRCLLQVERRTVPGESAVAAEAEIAAIMEAVAEADPQFVGSSLPTMTREPFTISPDAPIVCAVRAAAGEVLGQEPPVVGAFGWMDSSILDQAGIPTVIFGPTGAGAHALEEWVSLRSVEHCRDVLLATARSFCGAHDDD